MTDGRRPKLREPLPVRRIIFWIGIALVLAGYGFLSTPPEAGVSGAEERVFKGLGLVVAGAVLWLGTFLFPE